MRQCEIEIRIFADPALDRRFPGGSAHQDLGPAVLPVPDFDVGPGDAVAAACSHGFQDRLLGSPSSREVLDGVLPRLAIADLTFGINAAQEELAVVLDHLADARAFDDVGADSEDFHSAPSSGAHARSGHSMRTDCETAKKGPASVFSLHPVREEHQGKRPAILDPPGSFRGRRGRAHCGSALLAKLVAAAAP